MGQNVSTVQEYTPDNKPAKMENSHSLEKPRNENEENKLNERSEKAEKEKQKKLGINVMKKHSEMPMKMESFIIDTIIVEKLKHSGHFAEIANAVAKKLNNQYGGFWCAIIAKSWCATLNGCLSTINGTHIFLAYENCNFTVFQSLDEKCTSDDDMLPPQKNFLYPEKPENENENNDIKKRESLKATQNKLGFYVLEKKCINKDSILPMKTELESFMIDAMIVEKIRHLGDFNGIGRAVKEKLEDQYGGRWNVLIAKNWHSSESGYCLATVPGSYIVLKYDFCTYTIFKGT